MVALPRSLIIINVIFGPALRDHVYFYHSEVASLVSGLIDRGNVGKVLDSLLTSGWIDVFPAEEGAGRPTGRHPMYCYKRTEKGEAGYAAMAQVLAQYGIHLGPLPPSTN